MSEARRTAFTGIAPWRLRSISLIALPMSPGFEPTGGWEQRYVRARENPSEEDYRAIGS